MAVIVRSKKSEGRYAVLGAGFGMFKSVHTSPLFGGWAPNRDSGSKQLLAVSNAKGEAGFLPIEDVEVVLIDGVSPEELLQEEDV